LDWFGAESRQAYEEFADKSSTAQVHPLNFTDCVAKLAEQGEARIIIGMVEHINCSDVHGTSVITSALLDAEGVVLVTYTDKATSKKPHYPNPNGI
jgi:hypothetical protein